MNAMHCGKYSRIRVFSNQYFPYDFLRFRICDSVLIRENTSQRKALFWHILRSDDSYIVKDRQIFCYFLISKLCENEIISDI